MMEHLGVVEEGELVILAVEGERESHPVEVEFPDPGPANPIVSRRLATPHPQSDEHGFAIRSLRLEHHLGAFLQAGGFESLVAVLAIRADDAGARRDMQFVILAVRGEVDDTLGGIDLLDLAALGTVLGRRDADADRNRQQNPDQFASHTSSRWIPDVGRATGIVGRRRRFRKAPF
jgi:hypothetical protein